MLPWENSRPKAPDPVEARIPIERREAYRLIKGLIGLLDIVAADILGPTEAEARLERRRTR